MILLASLKTNEGVSPGLQHIAVIRRQITALSPTGEPLNLSQSQHIGFQDDRPFIETFLDGFAMPASVLLAMDRYDLCMKFETEARFSRFSPPVECRSTEAAQEFRRLLDVQVAIAILVYVRFVGFASHSETTANSVPRIQPEITFPPAYVPHPNSQADGFFD